MSNSISFGKEYRCQLPYEDYYVDFKVTDKFVPYRVGLADRIIWVYPKSGHPIPLDVLVHCFEEV